MDRENKPKKYDLLENNAIYTIFRDRRTQVLLQMPGILFLAVVLFAGLFGIQNSNMNIATISIWVIWWSVVIISVLLFGRVWCMICPFGAAGDWIQRRGSHRRIYDPFSLNKRFPARLKNLSIPVIFFLIITWIDFQFNLVNSPVNTAYFIISLIGLIMIISIIFERRSFCRYVCPITGLIGLYSMPAPFELRAKDGQICRTCREKHCISGNENGYPCPVFEYPGTMEKNTYCILCTECVKTCKKNNIALNVRPFAEELSILPGKRGDEAVFILILLGITVFQTLIMTRPWTVLMADLMVYTGAGYDFIRFILFIAVSGSPLLFYSSAIGMSKLFNRKTMFKELFMDFSYSLIPMGLMMHISHNIRHLLEEGTGLIPILSDPLGYGWNLFGSSGYIPSPLLSNNSILLSQWFLLLTGLKLSLSSGNRISKRLFHDTLTYMPVMIFIVIFFLLNIWVSGQPIMHKH